MIPTNDEKYELKLYKRLKNSDYQWESAPSIIFRGRPASQVEVKKYRVQKGVNGNTDSVFIKATNLPTDVSVGDKVEYLGKFWSVQSIGYYFEEARFINPSVFDEERLIDRCPKGINLQ